MKALSIQQPWAWLIGKGIKPVENRTWKCGYRGPLLIHAGKTFDWEGLNWLSKEMPDLTPKLIAHFGLLTVFRRREPKDLGGIVGSVDMLDCVKAHPSPFFCGPYGFVFNNAKELPFVAMPGKLGIFDVDFKAAYAGG